MNAVAVAERLDLPPDPSSVARARGFVCARLAAWGFDALAETAALLTSELASNVVRHARTPYAVVIRRTFQGAMVDVLDASREVPELRAHDLSADSGRGLALVAVLSSSWGATPASDLEGFTKGVRFSLS